MSSKNDKHTAIYTAFDDFEHFDPSRPERDLLLAVLSSAISDLNQPGDVGRKAKEFFLNKDQDYLFSFQSICGFLNLAPGQVLMVAGLKQGSKGREEPNINPDCNISDQK